MLLDILEVPQLMDICVRNGNYDDALDLRAFVAKLALIHPQLQVRMDIVYICAPEYPTSFCPSMDDPAFLCPLPRLCRVKP